MDPQLLPPRPDSPPRRLRACAPCTRAKARCNFREKNARQHLCDRCERLKIDCSAKTRGVRRTRQIKPLVNRVATLEQQIAHLVTPEKSPAASTPSAETSTSTPSTSSPPSHSNSHSHPSAPLIQRNPPGPVTHNLPSYYQSSSSHSPSSSLVVTSTATPPLGLTWSQASNILADFRANFVPNFPFIQIDGPTVEPGSGSPQRLAREKPFLFRAVMLAAAPVGKARAEAMHREVLADMGRRMMLEEEGGLDLLQGVLVIILWAECRYWFDKQITRLVYTALGYAHSLGITKPPRSLLQPSPCRPGSQYPAQQQWQQWHQQQQPEDCFSNKASLSATEHHTLEEQRTFLGLFCVVTSNCAQFSRRQNPLLHCLGSDGGRKSSQGQQQLGYLDVCYENLAASGSLEDRMAARMFKMAATSARVADGFGPVIDGERGRGMGDGFEEEVGRIRAGVEDILEGLDPREPSHAYLNLQQKALLVQLYEPATKPPTSSSSSSLYPPAVPSTTYLHAALSAAKTYFDAVLALPPEAYIYRTSVDMGLAQGVLAVTTRLLILHGVEGWDLPRARAKMNFADVCDNLIAFLGRVLQTGRERMGRLKEETWVRGGCGRAYNTVEFDWDDISGGSDIDVRGSMCEDLIGKMGWIKDWYETRVRAEDSGVTTTAGGGGGGSEAANKELMEEIARIWHWPADAASMPMFGGLINPFDICYDSI
ncbi:hypothetical protein BDP81DRAFT_88325 [Colletotrichum phormii]|uniref:Zn(2)-C6 fungal-type domain-containing protein n=1 Tax=Colletotrichum phormii TaxID=359342 RepID=A0AAJ0EKN6_9PEZI|nr:uncharacterized protein BDP81DRAFT_88325 [Colletotrichum phormii]KAK1654767.1 hypothetical protein BDP81DRAFT_88325 [Colletotrichum phormii]